MDDYIDMIFAFFLAVNTAILLSLLIVLGIKISNGLETDVEITSAKPVYQQPIGDDVKPDVLIIYEAEIDGEKVYPSVVKEAE